MPTHDPLLDHLTELKVLRLGEERPAGLWITSLPLPRRGPREMSLAGRPTHVRPLGHWHDMDPDEPAPRRLLLVADAGGGAAPAELPLHHGPPSGRGAPSRGDAAEPPTAEERVFAHAPAADVGTMYWERPALRIAWRGRWIELAMGMRVRGEVHWWEHCNLVVLDESPTCREVEMGGAIPHELASAETMKQFKDKDNPFIHRHNWLNGHIYARLHGNGVCEVFARHVNAMFADDGLDLPDAVPVLGVRVVDVEKAAQPLLGAWDGAAGGLDDLRIGDVRLDVTEVARLATPRQPGRMDLADGFLAWQPYQGVELFSGPYAKLRTGDPFVLHAEQQVIPRGMARTLRFSLSLADDRPPRVARYLAPAWWYGACEEFMPEPLLPVRNEYDAPLESSRTWFRKYMVSGGFEDGEFPNEHSGDPAERHTPATEGDVPGAMFHMAYRYGDAVDYDCAMRASYCFTDVFIDHAVKRVRMQDFTPPAVALPLQRVHGPLAAWLETGDAFCLSAARAVIDTAYYWHKNSWPRRAVGRDARFVHSAILLYRYLGDRRVLEQARDTIRDVGAAQWPDGTFGDQGGGAGIHGQAAYVVKPWMGWLATMGVLDYLELFPEDAEAFEVVRQFAEWLMREFGPREAREPRGGGAPAAVGTDPVRGWTYMHPFRGKALPDYEPPREITKHHMHLDYTARLLTYMSLRTGDSSYFDAFADSYHARGPQRTAGYWELPSTLYFLPWLQAKLWNARVAADGIEVTPVHFGPRTPTSGTILAPQGELEVAWSNGHVVAPQRVRVVEREEPVATRSGG